DAVVDVDGPARQRRAPLGRQNLHGARRHHQADLVLPDQVEDLQALLRPGLGRTGQVVEGNPIRSRHARVVVVIRGDGGDLDRQLAAVRAEQQVVQAVPLAAYQNEQSGLAVGVMDAGVHAEALGHGGKAFLQRFDVGGQGQLEVDAKKKAFFLDVAELLGVDDVAMQAQQPAGNAMHDADAVGTGKGKNEVVHGSAGYGASGARSKGLPCGPGDGQAGGQTRGFYTEEVDEAGDTVRGWAGNDEVGGRLAGTGDFRAYASVARLQGLVRQAGPILAYGLLEKRRAARVERVVGPLHPLHIRSEARLAAKVERQVHAQARGIGQRVDQAR